MNKKELDQLYLSKNERLGIMILLMFLLILILLPWLHSPKNQRCDNIVVRKEMISKQESFPINAKFDNKYNYKDSEYLSKSEGKKIQTEVFSFNPNNLSYNEAIRLGISKYAFNNLQKYLATGAKIKSADQLLSIYGIDSQTYHRIKSHVILDNFESSISKEHSIPIKLKIDLNSAELSDLLPLPGIGKILGERIIKYRNALGGYIHISQLNEVFGLQDSCIEKIRPKIFISKEIRQIPINEVDSILLIAHPYFGYKKAKLLMAYKNQHGKFKEIGDFYKMKALDSTWIEKVKPYLNFN